VFVLYVLLTEFSQQRHTSNIYGMKHATKRMAAQTV
jgi:hypothetical protein